MQLKYHETGKEKECLPQVGQWNMMNKVQCCCLYIQHVCQRLLKASLYFCRLWYYCMFTILQKVINGCTVNHWACINFSRSIQESTAHGFCQELAQTCQTSGMVKISAQIECFYFHRFLFACYHVYVKFLGSELHALDKTQEPNNTMLWNDFKLKLQRCSKSWLQWHTGFGLW